MLKVTGQILRMGGLLVEMLGVLGILTGAGASGRFQWRLPDGSTLSLPWVAAVLGFVLWLLGRTMLVFGSRSSRRIRAKEGDESAQ